ncbi:MAG: hypothetical protein AB7O60_19620 [Variibacter sp.]
MKKLAVISSLIFFGCSLPATAKHTYNTQVGVSALAYGCMYNGGQWTSGKGKGGYGCNYKDGDTVSCDKKHNCTYTTPDTHRIGTANDIRAHTLGASIKSRNSGAPTFRTSPNPSLTKTNSALAPKQSLTTNSRRKF